MFDVSITFGDLAFDTAEDAAKAFLNTLRILTDERSLLFVDVLNTETGERSSVKVTDGSYGKEDYLA